MPKRFADYSPRKWKVSDCLGFGAYGTQFTFRLLSFLSLLGEKLELIESPCEAILQASRYRLHAKLQF